MLLKVSSGKWRPFFLGLNELKAPHSAWQILSTNALEQSHPVLKDFYFYSVNLCGKVEADEIAAND